MKFNIWYEIWFWIPILLTKKSRQKFALKKTRKSLKFQVLSFLLKFCEMLIKQFCLKRKFNYELHNNIFPVITFVWTKDNFRLFRVLFEALPILLRADVNKKQQLGKSSRQEQGHFVSFNKSFVICAFYWRKDGLPFHW